MDDGRCISPIRPQLFRAFGVELVPARRQGAPLPVTSIAIVVLPGARFLILSPLVGGRSFSGRRAGVIR